MKANKLETVLSRDRLACLAPPDMVLLMYIHIVIIYMYVPNTWVLLCISVELPDSSEGDT